MSKAARPRKAGRSSTKSGSCPTFDPNAIELVDLSALVPAPVNNKIYKPVLQSDPGIRELAELIERDGLLDPIVITLDWVIVSGHRRRVACQIAGLTKVRVRRIDLYSNDPRFERVLVGFNRSRNKTVDEVLREAVVETDQDAAHQALLSYRRAKSDAAVADVEPIVMGEAKRRKEISAAKEAFLTAVGEIVDRLRTFWPLTVRQVHYQLLNDPPLRHSAKPGSRYANDLESYKDLCNLMSRARLTGAVPWAAITDETRPHTSWEVHPSPDPFIREETADFLTGYHRDLVRSQPVHVEVVGEKMTVQGIITPVAAEYCLPVTIGRGYSSLGPRRDLALRFKRSGKDRLVVLFLSDFDPEGESIAESFARSLRDDFGVVAVTPVKVALTGEQVRELALPPQMKAKAGSSRRKGFVEQHGENVYELESIPPDRLQEMLRSKIESVLDMDLFRSEEDREKEDAVEIDRTRQRLFLALGGTTDPPAPAT